MYKPLPEEVTIKKSSIEGLGLFATCDIKKGYTLGISHVKDSRFEHGYIRTPLGGFFNDSNEPNCNARTDGDYIKLTSIKDIKNGDELTVKYWLYDLEYES